MSNRIDRFLAERIREAWPSARVLDLPAGDGNLTRALIDDGHTVIPADLFPESFTQTGPKPVRADMNETLPFDDASFDAIVSQEGIEHLENLPGFFRECRRILRPGGRVWMTTPNFMDLSSRLAFFLTGMKSFHGGFPNEETTLWGRDEERVYHGHAFTLPYFQIRYLLRTAGFGEVAVTGLKPSPTSRILRTVVRPVSGILIRRGFAKLAGKRRNHGIPRSPGPDLARQLRRDALSPELLCFKKICVTAVAEG